MNAPAAPSPAEVFATLRDRPGAAWLDGGTTGWSILVWDPVDRVTEASGWPAAGRTLTHPGPGDADLPFVSGVLGYVGYEAGAEVAPVPAGGPSWEPPVHLARYEGALLHHGPTGRWVSTGAARVREQAQALLAAATVAQRPMPTLASTLHATSPADYRAAISRIQAWLHEGDCYQVNLSRVVHVTNARPAWEAWLQLRATTTPERGAFLVLADGVRIASASPERLLDVDGRSLLTVPIKGTRPRGADPTADLAQATALAESAKERAELVMIVDLCRNDLGRVAVPGSIVAAARTVRPTPYCHHAEQAVQAELAPGQDAWHALAALFPPGSVTGAPKVRACHRIAELEPEPRGVYCGAIGYVSDHGRAAWSVAIRTAVWQGDRARYHVGGGIVVDSDPDAEWEETLVKGARLAEALQVLPARA